MQRNFAETVLGAAVLLVAAGFLFFFSRHIDAANIDGYNVTAAFTHVDGLEIGTPVRIGGIVVGKVTKLALDPDTYRAVATLTINRDIKLPTDTSAVIASAGLLDGKYLTLQPGGNEEMLADGGRIDYTQSPPGLEQLLGQVVFSLTNNKDDKKSPAAAPGAPAAPHPPVSVPDMN